MKVTILGATGFVGRHLRQHFEAQGATVHCPPRGAELAGNGPLGHVIYAIGLTGDFRSRPFATVEAHVTLLSRVLEQTDWDSFLYLSTTRSYAGLPGPVDEETPLTLLPSADRLYDLTKLTGESLVLAQPNPAARVARLSNVVGANQSTATFLGSLMQELRETGSLTIREDPQSSKDYVDIADVTRALPRIATDGAERLYNISSGVQTPHQQIADLLAPLGRVGFAPNGPLRRFPVIKSDRMQQEFGLQPTPITASIAALIGSAAA